MRPASKSSNYPHSMRKCLGVVYDGSIAARKIEATGAQALRQAPQYQAFSYFAFRALALLTSPSAFSTWA